LGLGMPLGLPELPLAKRPRASRARDKRDQDQPIEIPRFRVRKTGDNRKDQADRQLFPASRVSGKCVKRSRSYRFMVRSNQGEGPRSIRRAGEAQRNPPPLPGAPRRITLRPPAPLIGAS
jgi:hypothetical protein